MRSWGKQDSRAGGDDMMVLGTHIFDMMRLFAGDAQWCSAQVLSKGHEITRADARTVAEKIGPVAGDEIEAQFGFANGVTATFTSRARLRDTLGHWAVELLGSKGAVRILMDIDPVVLHRRRNETATGATEEWLPLKDDPMLKTSSDQRGFGPANRRVVEDWLDAIEHDRESQCSGRNAMKAIEMVMAVYHAALNHTRVALPLKNRNHPLQ
jgi:predicted dehydrogenase